MVQILCIRDEKMDTSLSQALGQRASFDQFMESLRDSDSPALSARAFGQALKIDLQTLAQQAHVHRNTLSRAPGSESVQRFLREAIRVLRAASDVSGDVERALFWYRNEPLPVFGYKTAEQLVSDGRADDVVIPLRSAAARRGALFSDAVCARSGGRRNKLVAVFWMQRVLLRA